MKKIICGLFVMFWVCAAQAQVGKISTDGNTTYAVKAQELRRQRAAAPTYEQLVPQNNKEVYNGAVADIQEAAQNELTSESNEQKDKKRTGWLRSFGAQKEARNLMIVQAVANYKLGDEKLANQFTELEDNAEYHRKLEQIMNNLSNSSMRNNKNREAVRILDDAGNRLYNLLSN